MGMIAHAFGDMTLLEIITCNTSCHRGKLHLDVFVSQLSSLIWDNDSTV